VTHRSRMPSGKPNLVQSVRVYIFSKWRSSAILDFEISKILARDDPARRISVDQFGANRFRNDRDVRFNVLSRWRPCAILNIAKSVIMGGCHPS